jgi:hypothetical protein
MHRAVQFGYSFFALLAVGCPGKTGETPNCPAGSERCSCYGNGTCNDSLECRSNLCVASGTGGTTSTGSTTSSGGTRNAGGAGAYTGGIPGIGGAGFNVGGSGTLATGGTVSLLNYCNGLFSGQVCSQISLQTDVNAVNMLLVIDDSGSMGDVAGTATTNKWVELNQSLAELLVSFENEVNFGLELFPYDPMGMVDTTNPDSSCGVPLGADAIAIGIAPGTANLAAILDKLRSQTPAGGTPLSKALQQAYTYFIQGNGKSLVGSKQIILATDGGPNCNGALQCLASTCTQNLDGKCGDGSNPTLNCCDTSTASGAAARANLSCLDDLLAVVQINGLKAAGVQTYVIGLPGSEIYASTLNALANAGGVPNPNVISGASYYAVPASNSLQGLKDAFVGIIAQSVKTCDFKLGTMPTNPVTVQVARDCQFIPPLPGNKPAGPDAGTTDGYYIDYSQNPAHLVLTGSYCQGIVSFGGSHLDVISGCYNPN